MYYFDQYLGTCKQRCKVLDNGIMIGSVKCQKCKHCKDYDKDIHGHTEWVICEKIDDAVGS